jgi:hypothetical protein
LHSIFQFAIPILAAPLAEGFMAALNRIRRLLSSRQAGYFETDCPATFNRNDGYFSLDKMATFAGIRTNEALLIDAYFKGGIHYAI